MQLKEWQDTAEVVQGIALNLNGFAKPKADSRYYYLMYCEERRKNCYCGQILVNLIKCTNILITIKF